jgi:hypothetical protein
MTPDDLARTNTEAGHQRAFFAELRQIAPAVYDVTFAIPNGGKREAATASNLVAEGVKKGVHDIFCAWPLWCGYAFYCGLFIEMKRPADRTLKRRAGKTSDAQDLMTERFTARGYKCVVAYEWREAIGHIYTYFSITPSDPP